MLAKNFRWSFQVSSKGQDPESLVIQKLSTQCKFLIITESSTSTRIAMSEYMQRTKLAKQGVSMRTSWKSYCVFYGFKKKHLEHLKPGKSQFNFHHKKKTNINLLVI
jgi:hypothetical protein